MKRTLVVAGSLGVLIAVGWFSLISSEPRTEANVTSPAAPITQPRAVAAEPALRSCTMKAGQTLASQLTASSRSQLTGLDVRLEVTGKLELEVLSSTAQAAVLAGRFSQMKVSSEVPVGALDSPFLVEIDEHCRLTRFARWKETPPHLARNEQALLWDSQWSTQEGVMHGADGIGPFTAVVRRRGAQVERELESYSAIWKQRATPAPARGLLVVTMGDGPWFESIDSHRTVAMTDGSIDSRLSMRRVAANEGRFLPVERDETSYVWGDLLPAVSSMHGTRPVTRYDRERRDAVSSQALEVAMQTLETRARDASTGLQDTWPNLSAWLEVHPERIGDAVKSLKSGELVQSDRGGIAFYIALGNARVPEARDALLGIKRDALAPPLEKARAMFALIDRDDVGVPLARELARDTSALTSSENASERYVANKAVLALTAMSGLRNDVDVHDVAVEVVTGLLTSRTPEQRKLGLKGLGNIGDVTLMPLAQSAMNDPDSSVREAATAVFRRMPPVQTDDVVLAWLQREQHPFVKAKLYDVLRSQHHDAQFPASRGLAMQALDELSTTRSMHARRQMIRLIVNSEVAQEPEVRRALVQQARQERARDSELVNEFTEVLTEAEVWEVLR